MEQIKGDEVMTMMQQMQQMMAQQTQQIMQNLGQEMQNMGQRIEESEEEIIWSLGQEFKTTNDGVKSPKAQSSHANFESRESVTTLDKAANAQSEEVKELGRNMEFFSTPVLSDVSLCSNVLNNHGDVVCNSGEDAKTDKKTSALEAEVFTPATTTKQLRDNTETATFLSRASSVKEQGESLRLGSGVQASAGIAATGGDPQQVKVRGKRQRVCMYYALGRCRLGEECLYLHCAEMARALLCSSIARLDRGVSASPGSGSHQRPCAHDAVTGEAAQVQPSVHDRRREAKRLRQKRRRARKREKRRAEKTLASPQPSQSKLGAAAGASVDGIAQAQSSAAAIAAAKNQRPSATVAANSGNAGGVSGGPKPWTKVAREEAREGDRRNSGVSTIPTADTKPATARESSRSVPPPAGMAAKQASYGQARNSGGNGGVQSSLAGASKSTTSGVQQPAQVKSSAGSVAATLKKWTPARACVTGRAGQSAIGMGPMGNMVRGQTNFKSQVKSAAPEVKTALISGSLAVCGEACSSQ